MTHTTIEQVKAERDRVLAQPETRARYCLQFYYDFMDPEMNRKALDRFSEFMDVIEYNIEPYELYWHLLLIHMKTDMNKEIIIDHMGEAIFERFAHFMDQHDYETANCLHSEWNVDGVDPEDGKYEFLFLEYLAEVWGY